MEWLSLAGGVTMLLAAVLVVRGPARRFWRDVELERARELFQLQQARLEEQFFQLASSSGKPKGLRWRSIAFHGPPALASERASTRLTAFHEITIQFDAEEGGGMEDVPAVADGKHATAVFHYHAGQWGTGGRVLFNMTPAQAVHHFGDQFELAPTLA